MCTTQQRKIADPVHLGAFILSCPHLEFLGLMVMAWRTLNRQVLPLDTPLASLWIY